MIALRLSDDERGQLLAAHPASWQLLTDRDAIGRSLEFPTVLQAFDFMQHIILAADAMDHYPLWANRHGSVTIVLTTPEVVGLSEADGRLATVIDQMATRYFGPTQQMRDIRQGSS